MPRRTNLFQEVVAILHGHLAGDAEVEESALLTDAVTGADREVDVVIRSQIAGHGLIISVEASARQRKADALWVEQTIGKHSNLPTHQLVLVAQSGFTRAARRKADAAKNVAAIAPVDLGEDDPVYEVVNALPSLWPKEVSLTPDPVAMATLTLPSGVPRVVTVPLDTALYFDTEEEAGTVQTAFQATYDVNFAKFADDIDLADIAEDCDRHFVMGVGPPWNVHRDGVAERLYFRDEPQDGPPELHRLESLRLTGRAAIRVGEVPLEHRRLGEVTYAYGEGRVGERSMLVVVSENEHGKRGSLRARTSDRRQ